MPENRTNAGRFQAGQSGNPGGRPKDQFRQLIQKESKDGKELVRKAFALLRKSKDEDIQIKALNWLSDRGWGKAAQPIEGSGEGCRMVLIFPEAQ